MPSSRERHKGLIGRGHDLRLAALRRVTHEDWSLGFTSSTRGALEEPIIQVRCSDSPRGLFAGAHPNPLQTFPVTFTRTWLVIEEREVSLLSFNYTDY